MHPPRCTGPPSRSTDRVNDLRHTLDELPLFPLHQAVLFPNMLLPLHVFERRYRKLVDDVLQTHRTLGIAHVMDPAADMRGHPPIAQVAGVGTIVDHAELPGGRYNIVLRGRARVTLQELQFREPYRRALATLLESVDDDAPAVELAAVHAAANSFTGLIRRHDPAFAVTLPKNAPAGVVADAYAHQLIVSPRQRQEVLETVDIEARLKLVTELLTIQRATLAHEPSRVLN